MNLNLSKQKVKRNQKNLKKKNAKIKGKLTTTGLTDESSVSRMHVC